MNIELDVITEIKVRGDSVVYVGTEWYGGGDGEAEIRSRIDKAIQDRGVKNVLRHYKVHGFSHTGSEAVKIVYDNYDYDILVI